MSPDALATSAETIDAPARRRRYRWGLIMAAGGGLCLSFGGLILRSIESDDGFQILALRSLTFSATLILFLLVRNRGNLVRPFREIGWLGFAIAPPLGLGFVCYLFAMMLTSVANVVFIISLSPVFAAVVGWLVLRERVPPATLGAIALAVAGVAVMVSGGLAGEGLLGMAIALGAPLTFALLITVQRRQPEVDMIPAVLLSGVVAGAIAYLGVDAWTLSERDIALSLFMGAGQVGAGFLLITLGARWLPPAQTALLALSEAVLAPLWVWLFVDEIPAAMTLIGGAMILVAVAGQALAGMKASGSPRPD